VPNALSRPLSRWLRARLTWQPLEYVLAVDVDGDLASDFDLDLSRIFVLLWAVAFIVTLTERMLSRLLASQRPARARLAAVSVQNTPLWFLATLLHTIAWWLVQPTSLASLFIIAQQWTRYGQVRSIGPTVVFAMIEIGTIVAAQLAARAAEVRINSRTVLRGERGSSSPSSSPSSSSSSGSGDAGGSFLPPACRPMDVAPSQRQMLRIGDFVRLSPGDESPATVLLIGAVVHPGSNAIETKDSESGRPLKFVVSTAGLDGETSGKERSFAGWPPDRALLVGDDNIDPSSSSSSGEDVAAAVARTLELPASLRGQAGGPTADAHLGTKPNVVRHGARITDTAPWDVWGLIIGFNGAGSGGRDADELTSEMGALEAFLQWVARLHVALLVGYTAASVSIAVFGRGREFNVDLVVELLLANNVALLMTLSAVTGVVIWMLHRDFDRAEALDTRSKHALVALTEAIAQARAHERSASTGRRRIAGIHFTDKTGTITRNEMLLQGSVPLCGVVPGQELAFFQRGGDDHAKKPFGTLVENDDLDNSVLAAIHVALTSNSPLSPNLEPEEQAYSVGLGVVLLDVDTHVSGLLHV
jgi:hypothetical protein